MGFFAIFGLILFLFLFKKKNSESTIPSVPNTTTMCSRYSMFILGAGSKFAINPKILDAMIFVESSDGANVNHTSGEIGVMAVKQSAAADVRKEFPELKLYILPEPHDNIFLAAGYLRMCFNVWQDWDKAIVAYNVGIRNPAVNGYANHPYLKLVKERMNVQC